MTLTLTHDPNPNVQAYLSLNCILLTVDRSHPEPYYNIFYYGGTLLWRTGMTSDNCQNRGRLAMKT